MRDRMSLVELRRASGWAGARRPGPPNTAKFGSAARVHSPAPCAVRGCTAGLTAGPTLLSDHILKLRRVLVSVIAMGRCPPFAWNGSWDDALNYPSAV